MDKIEKDKIYQGDALEVLKTFPNESIDCCVTSPPYFCYADDTEILTNCGWKFIKDVKLKEKVMTLNPATNQIYWENVINTFKYDYNGEMYNFKNFNIDLLVTPNHKMFIYNRKKPLRLRCRSNGKFGKYVTNKNEPPIYLVESQNIKTGHVIPLVRFKWKGVRKKYFILPELQVIYNKQNIFFPSIKINMNVWVKFLGFWIAEGSVRGSKGGKKIIYGINMKQKKSKNIKMIKDVLNQLPFKVHEYKSKDGLYAWEITNRQLWEYMKQFGNSFGKFIPQEIKELPPKLLKYFLNFYLMGDGNISPKFINKMSYKLFYKYGDCYSVSEQLRNDLQEILLKAGTNGKINANYVVIMKRKSIKLKNSIIKKQYNGKIVCLEVEKNNIVYVRRNGKAVFCGNSLRDYGVDKQIGMEDTPEQYINKLVEVFREVKRCLTKQGTFWLNIGDSYAGNCSQASNNGRAGFGNPREKLVNRVYEGIKPKDLIGIPWMLAFALRSDGWWLRSDIIWHKPSALPESVLDRPTRSHEHVFLLSKSQRYYYDNEVIKENTVTSDNSHRNRDETKLNNTPGRSKMKGLKENNYNKRNKRDVWTIPTQPLKEAHFASFAPALIIPMIQAGCPSEVCIKCGTPREKIYENGERIETGGTRKKDTPNIYDKDENTGYMTKVWNGKYKQCDCGVEFDGGIVLDPFMGSGTSAFVAKQLGRHYVGIELNFEYIKIAEKRISNELGIFNV